jgi:hypothetical protein
MHVHCGPEPSHRRSVDGLQAAIAVQAACNQALVLKPLSGAFDCGRCFEVVPQVDAATSVTIQSRSHVIRLGRREKRNA